MSNYYKGTSIKIQKTEKELAKLRYSYFLNELSEQTKSEFIDGEIVIQSPAMRKHIDINTSLTILFKLYIEDNKLGWLASEKALVQMQNVKNDYEPDICFFNTKKTVLFDRDTCQFPPPDLAIEILSESSVYRDRKKKFKDYADHDVEEYWIIEPDKYEIEQYYLEKTGKYILVKKYTEADTIESITVKNLKFPVAAAFFYNDLDNFLFGKYKKDIEDYANQIKIIDKLLKKSEQIIEQKEQVIEQNEQVIEQKEQIIEQKEQIIEQKNQELEQKNQALQNSVKAMLLSGMSVEDILKITKLSKKYITNELTKIT